MIPIKRSVAYSSNSAQKYLPIFKTLANIAQSAAQRKKNVKKATVQQIFK